MREFDSNGLKLALYQAQIFFESTNLDCSTAIFLRRFFNSSFLKKLDQNETYLLSLCTVDAFYEINQEFGESHYGTKKEDKEALYWVGYLYRYISYTRGFRTKAIVKVFDYKTLLRLYPTFHTQGMEWVVESLLELYKLPSNYFEKNQRLRELLKRDLDKRKYQ